MDRIDVTLRPDGAPAPGTTVSTPMTRGAGFGGALPDSYPPLLDSLERRAPRP